MIAIHRIYYGALVGAGLLFFSVGCVSDEAVFTQGRLQAFCDRTIPMCSTRATCLIDDESFVKSQFPGGVRSVVRNTFDDDRLVVRILLTEALAPGTVLQVDLQSADCGQVDMERIADVDLFQEAGNDRVFEFELDFHGRGDHLLSVFSDMNAQYLLTVDFE